MKESAGQEIEEQGKTDKESSRRIKGRQEFPRAELTHYTP
jgi:hypothetical protein